LKVAHSPDISRWLLALLFCVAGVLHFVFPAAYARIIPPMFPAPLALVWISGVCEILGGLGVLLPRVRRAAGVGLIALLIAVFPANIYMLLQQQQAHGWNLYTFLLLLRLPLQFLLIAWVQRSTFARPK
jgi:uncharacterized membrane protein